VECDIQIGLITGPTLQAGSFAKIAHQAISNRSARLLVAGSGCLLLVKMQNLHLLLVTDLPHQIFFLDGNQVLDLKE